MTGPHHSNEVFPDPVDEPCSYCGATATDRDHLSGCRQSQPRRAPRDLFDDGLWLWSCHRCNVVGYQAWEANGLTVVVDPMVTRLRRVGLSTARVGRAERAGTVPPAFWPALSRLLVEAADELEARAR